MLPKTKNERRQLVARFREVFSYNKNTGALRWTETLSNRAPAGSLAGSSSNGHREVSVDGVSYKTTHVIWALVYGKLPVTLIDHKDGDGENDKLANLREAEHYQNAWNCRMHADNMTGFKGVLKHSAEQRQKIFQAKICVQGRRISLGYFHTPEEAHAAYVKAAAQQFGEFAWSRR